jgi:dienelactone hydrolase
LNLNDLRDEISKFLHFTISDISPQFEIAVRAEEEGYHRLLIRYGDAEGGDIPAFLLLPKGKGPFPAILVHHQRNREWHLGKSEVAGLAGNPLQAFGPTLAKMGIVVLAPDSLCFEDRRRNQSGLAPDEAEDWLQHYNEMCYRLLRGDTLMRKVLHDAACGVSLLWEYPLVDRQRIGTLGHSYGGNTVLFHTAVDPRVRFACSSGAACTYKTKIKNRTGIEMAEVLPGFVQRFDIEDLVTCIAPRRLLLVSATEDKYSKDADKIVEQVKRAFSNLNMEEKIEHKRYRGGHAITKERFEYIVNWVQVSSEQTD